MKARILVVEDEEYVRESLREVLASRGYEPVLHESAESAEDYLTRASVDAMLTDLRLPGVDGEELVARVQAQYPGLPVVVLTGHGTVKSAVRCIKAGAEDYILKPCDPEALSVSLERVLARGEMRRELERLRAGEAEERPEIPVGESAAWREVMARVTAAARTDSTVLLLGESGTGKELLARLVHARSPRAGRPCVRVNCSAVPLEMWESEFFGHRKGAFTGAASDREGRFRSAHGGTLFMDEIGTMPLSAQAKVLRVLESGEFERLGEERPTRVDVRIVAATNSDLESEVEAGHFRQDLYYRLNVVPILIPPLRERRDDIPLLVRHFVARIAARLNRQAPDIDPDVLRDLRAYEWPGNVRELRNVLERALILHPGDRLASLDLVPVQGVAPGEEAQDLRTRMAEAEKRFVTEALEAAGGVRKDAARRLGIDPRNLSYYLRKHGIGDETD